MRISSRRNIQAVILLSISLFISIGLSELFLRYFWTIGYRQPPRPLPGEVWRELLHRPSSVPGLAYELIPNREKFSHGAMIRTNSFGMRDTEPTLNKNASLLRIIVLGDSFTFGFGVSEDQTYSNILEKLLNEFTINVHCQYEVLNFGVGGYSTRDEAIVFKHKILPWNPRLVVIGYVLNDPEIEPVQPLHLYYQKPSWWQYSHVLRLIAKKRYHWDVKRLGGGGDYYRYLHSHNDKWMSVVDAFGEIKHIADVHGIKVAIVIFPVIPTKGRWWSDGKQWGNYPYKAIHKQVADTARENGFFCARSVRYFCGIQSK